MTEDRWRERTNTPECARFAERIAPIMEPFASKYSLLQVGPIRFYGSDPKGAGYLFAILFQAINFQVKIETVDGAAQVFLAAPGTPFQAHINDGWLFPYKSDMACIPSAPTSNELIELQAQLNIAKVCW